jgi:FtsH-binding integral membrane protein
MNDLDDQIREALRGEDAELYDHYRGELPVYEMLIETFRGRNRWLNVLAFLFTFVGLAMAIVSAYEFFHVESTQAMIAWATSFLWFVVWIAMLKIWFWLEMQKHSITREVKRLELQVANLSRQLAEAK